MSGCRGGSVERQHQGLSGGGGGAHLVRHGSRQQQKSLATSALRTLVARVAPHANERDGVADVLQRRDDSAADTAIAALRNARGGSGNKNTGDAKG